MVRGTASTRPFVTSEQPLGRARIGTGRNPRPTDNPAQPWSRGPHQGGPSHAGRRGSRHCVGARRLASSPDGAGFTLVTSRTIDAFPNLGPPVLRRDDLIVVGHRIGAYAHDDGLVACGGDGHERIHDPGPGRGAIARPSHGPLDDDTDRRAAYACGGSTAARWCFWATDSHLGWIGTTGYPARPEVSIASLRRLAVAIHDAVT